MERGDKINYVSRFTNSNCHIGIICGAFAKELKKCVGGSIVGVVVSRDPYIPVYYLVWHDSQFYVDSTGIYVDEKAVTRIVASMLKDPTLISDDLEIIKVNQSTLNNPNYNCDDLNAMEMNMIKSHIKEILPTIAVKIYDAF